MDPIHEPEILASDRGPTLSGITISFCVLATCLCITRLLVRIRITRSRGMEDYTIMLAVVSIHCHENLPSKKADVIGFCNLALRFCCSC